jgi:ATP-binding cassette subfamily B protein
VGLRNTYERVRQVHEFIGPFWATKKAGQLFSLGCLAVSVSALSNIATPWMIGSFIDSVAARDVHRLHASVIGLFGVAVMASLGGGARSIVGRHLSDLFRSHLRMVLTSRFLSAPLLCVEGSGSRNINSVFMDDLSEISTIPNPLGLNAFLSAMQLAGALTVLVYRFRGLAALALLIVPISLILSLWQWPRARAKAKEQMRNKTRLDSLTSEFIDGIKDIKSAGSPSWIQDKVQAAVDDDIQTRWSAYLLGSVDHARYSANWLLMSGLYLIGGLAVIRGRLSIGSVTAFIWYIGFLETPLSRLWEYGSDLQRISAALGRFSHTLNLPAEHCGVRTLGNNDSASLHIENVSFTYPRASSEALHGVSIEVEPGQNVAIVGRSGAGKTTLVSLILRLFDPDEGVIKVDNVDIREYSLDSLREFVSIISQDPFLIDGTIRENISFGQDQCSDASIRWAADVADASGFIEQLPAGYDSLVGARGVGLSGGQKKRIAIARAVLRKPKVLILDEVTGAVDSTSDRAIQQAIASMGTSCSRITISHRLSSIVRAEVIFVLDRGSIVGRGTHTELLNSCPSYAELAGLQELNHAPDTPYTFDRRPH